MDDPRSEKPWTETLDYPADRLKQMLFKTFKILQIQCLSVNRYHFRCMWKDHEAQLKRDNMDIVSLRKALADVMNDDLMNPLDSGNVLRMEIDLEGLKSENSNRSKITFRHIAGSSELFTRLCERTLALL